MALQVQRRLKLTKKLPFLGKWKTVYITTVNDMRKADADARYYVNARKDYGFGKLFDWRIIPYN